MPTPLPPDEPPFPGTDELGDDPEVWAGGGLVLRDGLVLLAHRPRYNDWSFPKGKLDPGETLAECALREVLEETGFVCTLGEPLVAMRYHDAKGRLKEVRYWMMTVVGGVFEPNDEVDEIRWLAPSDSAGLLSYPRDLEVLDAAKAHLS